MARGVRRFAPLFIKQRTMRNNLAAAFPELGEAARAAILSRAVANFGRLIAEVVHIPTFAAGAQKTSLTAEGALDSLAGLHGPAVFVSGHLGNWELVPILFRRHAHPLTIIYSRIGVDAIDRRFLALRRMTEGTYVEKSAALRASFRAMKRGQSVALLVDQRVDNGIEVEFFGRPTVFSHLPARLALRFGCPIVFVEAVRIAPGRVQAVFHEPIRPDGSSHQGAAHDATQRIARTLEDAIRRNPDQWFCNKRRWPSCAPRAHDGTEGAPRPGRGQALPTAGAGAACVFDTWR